MPLRSCSIAALSPKPLMVTLAPSAASARATAEPIQCGSLKPEALSRPSGMTLRCREVTMPQSVFPAPDHDHGRCASAAIAHAEMLCAARAQRLTPMRRHVLEALLGSHRPLGAYEIIERLARHGRPAPITVYRALDFLRDNGLVHRIESRNAFVACVHNHLSGDLVVFLICERCGAVGEAS